MQEGERISENGLYEEKEGEPLRVAIISTDVNSIINQN